MHNITILLCPFSIGEPSVLVREIIYIAYEGISFRSRR